MLYLRATKTASNATAVQIVRYVNRKKIVVKHIGSAHSQEELASLQLMGKKWIEQETHQQNLFPDAKEHMHLLTPIEKCVYLDTRYSFIYDVLLELITFLQFDRINNQLLIDLVIMRIIQPVSKLESLKYLSEMFGINYGRGKLYKQIASFSEFKKTLISPIPSLLHQLCQEFLLPLSGRYSLALEFSLSPS